MDWNKSTRTFDPLAESSLSFLYNYNNNPYPGMEVKQQALVETSQMLHPTMDIMNCIGNREKKKRLTSNQIESLERSFQEDIKLDPEKKMKLSRDLGLHPRQIAVWFQNRRTRWKTKKLEHLYDVLKQEFYLISEENQKLQEEVINLKARLREQAFRTQTFAGYTEISAEETVESKSEALRGSNKPQETSDFEKVEEGYCSFTVENYNTVSLPLCHWSIVPHYP